MTQASVGVWVSASGGSVQGCIFHGTQIQELGLHPITAFLISAYERVRNLCFSYLLLKHVYRWQGDLALQVIAVAPRAPEAERPARKSPQVFSLRQKSFVLIAGQVSAFELCNCYSSPPPPFFRVGTHRFSTAVIFPSKCHRQYLTRFLPQVGFISGRTRPPVQQMAPPI